MDEEMDPVQALDTIKTGKVTDEFLHYRQMRKRELERETGLVDLLLLVLLEVTYFLNASSVANSILEIDPTRQK